MMNIIHLETSTQLSGHILIGGKCWENLLFLKNSNVAPFWVTTIVPYCTTLDHIGPHWTTLVVLS